MAQQNQAVLYVYGGTLFHKIKDICIEFFQLKLFIKWLFYQNFLNFPTQTINTDILFHVTDHFFTIDYFPIRVYACPYSFVKWRITSQFCHH